jgi:hypothetical protein
MVNYSYQPRSLDQSGFRDFNTSMGKDSMQSNVFEGSPDAAYSYWLKRLNPTTVQDNMLRKLYTRMYADYEGGQITDPRNENPGTAFNWVDYLSRQDPNKELARYGPEARNENSRQYTRPARWVAF